VSHIQPDRKFSRDTIEQLSKVKGIEVPSVNNAEFVSNYIMPIVLKNSTHEKRDRIGESSHAAGIQTSVHYTAVHKISIYGKHKTALPKTEYITDNVIVLFMYGSLTNDEIDFIVKTLDKALDE
jgi:dTDP-4-amino-4,6-dideoxygalactose transaminase